MRRATDEPQVIPFWLNGAAGIEIGQRSLVMPLLEKVSWKLGRSIQWEGAKEQLNGDAKATELLSRAYRAPWQQPAV